jgi:glyoxylase-like metal-dependent hydrolase (beta-lactamase superfamily II)
VFIKSISFTVVTIAFLVTVALTGLVHAQQSQNSAGNAEVHIWPVHGNVYMLVGAGGNITLSVGKDGVLLVDSGTGEMSEKVLAAIRQFTMQRDPNGPPQSIRYIINTQVDSDHTGGNTTITASDFFKPLLGGEEIIAHDNVLKRMNETGNQASTARPTDTYLTGQYKLNRFFNGEGVQVIHVPAAHTDGDSIVWFRFSDVISTGDIFTDSYPVIDLQRGGSIQGIIDALNRTIDLVFPEFRSQGGTMLIPGHGRLSDLTELAYYRDMVTIVRDRVQDMIKRGMTLEQVKAAKLTVDFDPVYGRNPGSSERFVEAVYRGLSQTR